MKLVVSGASWSRSLADTRSRRYVLAVLEEYVSFPGTPCRASRQDRRLARDLYEEAVPLAAVRAALLLRVARRTFRSNHVCPLPPVRTLHYFVPIVEEVLHCPPEPGYVDHLALKLRPLVEAKAAGRDKPVPLDTGHVTTQSVPRKRTEREGVAGAARRASRARLSDGRTLPASKTRTIP